MRKKEELIKSNRDEIDVEQKRTVNNNRKGRRTTKDAFMHGVDNRKVSFYCSNCWDCIGSIKYSISASFMLESDMKKSDKSKDNPIERFENQIRRTLYLPETLKYYCENCGEEVTYIGVDNFMGPIVQKLNQAGIKTIFSCAGHYMNFYKGEVDIPYLSFGNIEDMKYFDMKNDLLRCWEMHEYGDEMKNPDLKFEIHLKYKSTWVTGWGIMNIYHLRDLYRYVLKYITHEEDDSDWVFYGIKPKPLTAKQQKELKAMQETLKHLIGGKENGEQ